MPSCGVKLIPHEEILTLEEIVRIVRVMNELGVRKVRLTGGEPMVRKNIEKLVADIKAIDGIDYIAMTTNGVIFDDKIAELKNAGLNAVNISLDTLDEKRFKTITGYEGVKKVYDAICRSILIGLKTKVNCVPIKEFNDKDIIPLAYLAKRLNVDVRFIELMPIGMGKDYIGIKSDEIINRLVAQFGSYKKCDEKMGNGPASYVTFDGFSGKIGFISPMSHKFCGDCNRVRLTADGMLKLCLYHNHTVDLKEVIRNGCTDEELKNVCEEAIMNKPRAHDFKHFNSEESDSRKMYQIGG